MYDNFFFYLNRELESLQNLFLIFLNYLYDVFNKVVFDFGDLICIKICELLKIENKILFLGYVSFVKFMIFFLIDYYCLNDFCVFFGIYRKNLYFLLV